MENIEKSVRRESRLAVFEHVVKKEKDSNNKSFVVNRLESDESSHSDSELIIDDERDEVSRTKNIISEFNFVFFEHVIIENDLGDHCNFKPIYIAMTMVSLSQILWLQ